MTTVRHVRSEFKRLTEIKKCLKTGDPIQQNGDTAQRNGGIS